MGSLKRGEKKVRTVEEAQYTTQHLTHDQVTENWLGGSRSLARNGLVRMI